jgi:hypothetical protein
VIAKLTSQACAADLWGKSAVCATTKRKPFAQQNSTLNAIAMQQAAPMQETMEEVKQLLDYCSSQEEAIITYQASNMYYRSYYFSAERIFL